MSSLPGREQQEGRVRQAGLRGGVGRVQPLLPLLLHVAVGQAEQPLPALPAGVVHPAHGEVNNIYSCVLYVL